MLLGTAVVRIKLNQKTLQLYMLRHFYRSVCNRIMLYSVVDYFTVQQQAIQQVYYRQASVARSSPTNNDGKVNQKPKRRAW